MPAWYHLSLLACKKQLGHVHMLLKVHCQNMCLMKLLTVLFSAALLQSLLFSALSASRCNLLRVLIQRHEVLEHKMCMHLRARLATWHAADAVHE